MNHEEVVSVRLSDLCRIADGVGAMIHDLDNGKIKYLRIELADIHDVIEMWVADEAVLGGGCHEHRCRPCRESEDVFWHQLEEPR